MKKDKQILVMEDDPQGRALLSDLIRYYGFQVDFVDSCQAARQRLLAKPYDGLLLDMWMRDGTGSDLLTWLRANGHQEPVVVMSESADYDQWIDLVNQGAADLLAKPVVPGQLKRALQMAMGEEILNDSGWRQVGV